MLLLFARSFGFFSLSPLFKWTNFTLPIRLGLALVTTLLLFPTFLEQPTPSSPFALLLLKEVALGYILGLIFSILFEAAALAAAVISNLMGISIAEIFDPLTHTSQPLLSRFFALAVGAILFATDGHHHLLRNFFNSFSLAPLGTFSFSLLSVAETLSLLFTLMLQFVAFPLFALLLVILFLALLSKTFPHMPILWLGLPLQLIVGLIALLIGLTAFPSIVEQGLHQLSNLIQHLLS